jgi:hypothetical protein
MEEVVAEVAGGPVVGVGGGIVEDKPGSQGDGLPPMRKVMLSMRVASRTTVPPIPVEGCVYLMRQLGRWKRW